MKYVKQAFWSLLIPIIPIVIVLLLSKGHYDEVINEYSKEIDSLNFEILKNQSVYDSITERLDSIIVYKTDTLKKIDTIYETKFKNIVNLPIDDKIKLLTINLSEENNNRE